VKKCESNESLVVLNELQLQSNKIKCLDNGISELKNLKTLRLDHNKIQEITEQEISSCLNLTHLNVSENQIKSLVVIK
jgi:Leucine-rich repeat (LRR) protein